MVAVYGRIEAELRSPLGVLVMARHRQCEEIAAHAHDRPYLAACASGAYVERTASGAHCVSPRHLIGHPSGETHANTFLPDGGFVLSFEPSSLALHLFGVEQALTHRIQTQLTGDIHRGEIANVSKDRRSVAGIKAGMLDALWTAWIRSANESAWFHDIPERCVARRGKVLTFSVSRGHQARAFRRAAGERLAACHRRRMLIDTFVSVWAGGLTWTQAAHAAGFSDSSHLSRAWRQTTGETPSASLRTL